MSYVGILKGKLQIYMIFTYIWKKNLRKREENLRYFLKSSENVYNMCNEAQ